MSKFIKFTNGIINTAFIRSIDITPTEKKNETRKRIVKTENTRIGRTP